MSPSSNLRQTSIYLTHEQKLAVIDVGKVLHSRLGPTLRHLALVGLAFEQRRLGLPVTGMTEGQLQGYHQGDIPAAWAAGAVLPPASGAPAQVSDDLRPGGDTGGGEGLPAGQGAAGGSNPPAPSAPSAPTRPLPPIATEGDDPFAHFAVSEDDVRGER